MADDQPICSICLNELGGQTGSSQPVTVHIRCGIRVSGIMCNQAGAPQIEGVHQVIWNFPICGELYSIA
ncbi:hypothetical protein PGTUg99_027762 [Puccinia graminis f. sp. tritici]|uniref:Uncharacterized protein n=1 Tax=Puccinia graminis f. sp. tritici TaxID=56615 RepID=A0A5B0S7G8_PUCGR|nr:hypothetical protein PGTUg99_027762 [Puccinia graminis f. sp. tritici]